MAPSRGGLAYGLVLVLALEAAVWECFLITAPPPGLAAGLALVGNAVLGTVGGRIRPGGAVGPIVIWLVVAVGLSLGGPLGDVIVPGNTRGLLFLVAGVLGAALALGQRAIKGPVSATPSGHSSR